MNDFHEIDKHRLDEEWEQQPRLYRDHAEGLADAERVLSQVEAELKVLRAEVELCIRRNPDEYGLEKCVEAAVKAAVETHESVKSSSSAVIQAHYKADMCKAAVRTLEHRKAALEELVRLHLADYFSSPKVEGEGGKNMKERKAEGAFKGKRGKQ